MGIGEDSGATAVPGVGGRGRALERSEKSVFARDERLEAQPRLAQRYGMEGVHANSAF
jgi:hypothetical protein